MHKNDNLLQLSLVHVFARIKCHTRNVVLCKTDKHISTYLAAMS